MANIVVTNRKASQSLRGASVLVTLDDNDIQTYLPDIIEGQLATNDSSNKTGTVGRVDYYGSSFQVIPIQPDRNFDSVSTYGYLAVSETITITL